MLRMNVLGLGTLLHLRETCQVFRDRITGQCPDVEVQLCPRDGVLLVRLGKGSSELLCPSHKTLQLALISPASRVLKWPAG